MISEDSAQWDTSCYSCCEEKETEAGGVRMCLPSLSASAAQLGLNTTASHSHFLGSGREGCAALGGCPGCSSLVSSQYLACCRRSTTSRCSLDRFPLLQTSVPEVKSATSRLQRNLNQKSWCYGLTSESWGALPD